MGVIYMYINVLSIPCDSDRNIRTKRSKWNCPAWSMRMLVEEQFCQNAHYRASSVQTVPS